MPTQTTVPTGAESEVKMCEMNADEIVRTLRCGNSPKGHRCSRCPVFSRYEHGICKATVDRFAADLIESLQVQLAELKESGFCASCRGCNAPTDSDRIKWCTDWRWRGREATDD